MNRLIALEPIPLTRRGLLFVMLLALLAAAVIASQPLLYTAAAIGGAAVLLLTIVRPEVGLALVAFSVPFGELVALNVGGLNLTTTEPLIGLVILAWLLRLAVRADDRVRLTPLFAALFIYLGAIALSAAVAPSLRSAGKEFIKWGEAFALVIVAANVLKTRRQIALVIGALLAAGVLAALQGFVQFFLRQGPDGFLIAGRFLRAYGTFGQPNPYAAFLGLSIPIAFAILLVGLTGRTDTRRVLTEPVAWLLSLPWQLAGVVVAFVALCAALGMSLSRNAWFDVATGLLVIMALRSRRTFLALLVALVLGLLVALLGALNLLPAVLTDRIAILGDYFRIFNINDVVLTPENWSVVERMATWQAGWDMFQSSPWYGVGPGAFQTFWPRFGDANWIARGSNPPHAHNVYLNALAETGVVGLAGYLVFLVGAVLYTTVRIRDGQRRRTAANPLASPLALALGGLGMLAGFSVFNLFDNIFVHGMTAQIGLTLGLIEAAARADATEEPTSANS